MYNTQFHIEFSSFLPLKTLSENALAIKRGEAVFKKAWSSNVDMEKIPGNFAQGHKGEKENPSFEIPIPDPWHRSWFICVALERCTAQESKTMGSCTLPLTWQSQTAPTQTLSGRDWRVRWPQNILTLLQEWRFTQNLFVQKGDVWLFKCCCQYKKN